MSERKAFLFSDTLRSERDSWGYSGIEILGPTPSYPARVRGQYRWQIILRGANPRILLDKILIPKESQKYYSEKIIHQFAPLDIYPWVNNFLNKWKPKLIIWIESDLWPVTMYSIKKKTIKSLLVNVRMSPNSFEKWKIIKFFYRQITDCFSDIFAQSQLDRDRIKKLTNRDIKYIGNLKLSSSLVFESDKKNRNLSISNKILVCK